MERIQNVDLLATAIVEQAINDYDFALRTIERLSKERNLTKHELDTLTRALRYKEEVERFLGSDWQNQLTPRIDGGALLKQIRENFKNTGKCRLKTQEDIVEEETA